MNSSVIPGLFVVLILLPWNPAVGQEDRQNATSVNTALDATSRVYAYTGFGEMKRVSSVAASEMTRLTHVEQDDTPFLRDSVVGRSVWEVRMENVYLDLKNWDPDWVKEHNPKTFTAIVDSASGRLLKIFSECAEPDPNLAPEPPAEIAAARLRATGEVYLRFSDGPPPISFLEALDHAAGSNPLQAKEILAVCVYESDMGKPARLVWCITGRGIPPVSDRPGSEDLPLYMRNRMRSIVDATTGKLIAVTTSPSVMTRDGDR